MMENVSEAYTLFFWEVRIGVLGYWGYWGIGVLGVLGYWGMGVLGYVDINLCYLIKSKKTIKHNRTFN